MLPRSGALALLCALALASIPGALLGSQRAHAAPHSTFYGIADAALLTSTATDTATTSVTDTPTPTDTPTDTPTPTATATPSPTPPPPTATPIPTPSNIPTDATVSAAASAAGWPQAGNNWCGIATVALIAAYLNRPVSQSSIAGLINATDSTSEWGSPPWIPNVGPGVTSDIARDFGTDPRSLAYGLTAVTGTQYHAIVDTNGAWNATLNIVDTVLRSHQPVSVFVDHGQHSVIVSGVDTKNNANPLTDPGSITAIHVWDPGVVSNSAIQRYTPESVPLWVWLNGNTDLGFAQYFKYPYSANQYSGFAYPFDPDPSVGPYAYVPSLYNHLWIGHYVYIAPVGYVDPAGTPTGITTTSYVSDWEFTPWGALIAGEASSVWPSTPAGYTGAIVSMPTNPPPPPPPVHVFSTKPLPKPHPKVVVKPKPVPTATPPRARPSPTPVPPASTQAAPPVAPVAPSQPPCAPLACALASMPPFWALALVAALLVGALLLALAMFAPRRRVRPQAANLAAAGTGAPLLPPMLDSDTTLPAHAEAEAAPDEPLAAEPVDSGPTIVPVLEADVAPPSPQVD